ncbi:hypothetical protein F4808DRAFT_467020 [Astrocystis sublimbata]|nr:hypothetical protein F4808DRAFT_467020 [Astrocystis sublimbata]
MAHDRRNMTEAFQGQENKPYWPVNTRHYPTGFKDVKACEEFRTLLLWWMDKIDIVVHQSIEKRSRDRVQEVRDGIPDATSRHY